MAGVWSGGGTITLDDGSSERIRCRATYAVGAGGNALNQSLTCASDSYRFNLSSNVIAQGSVLSGTWSEATRGVNGTLGGRGGGGGFQVVANAPGFTANISLTTRGNRQSVVIRSDSSFRAASISLSRS
jgi:ABC-type phosphate transport system substrate-binding protein